MTIWLLGSYFLSYLFAQEMMSKVPFSVTVVLLSSLAGLISSQSGAGDQRPAGFNPNANGQFKTQSDSDSTGSTTLRPPFLRQNSAVVSNAGGPVPNVIPWQSGRQPSSPNIGIRMNFTEYPVTKPGTQVAAFNAYGNTPWAGQTYTWVAFSQTFPCHFLEFNSGEIWPLMYFGKCLCFSTPMPIFQGLLKKFFFPHYPRESILASGIFQLTTILRSSLFYSSTRDFSRPESYGMCWGLEVFLSR